MLQRAEITEDLAGVGLSVEMTSHDIMLMVTGPMILQQNFQGYRETPVMKKFVNKLICW